MKTRAWKHNRKDRHQWGTAKANKRNTPFMSEDIDIEIWNDEIGYDNCDDGCPEEE